MRFKIICKRLLLGISVLLLTAAIANGQQARFVEEIHSLVTYPFGDANPIPLLTDAKKRAIYPYHDFHGYSREGEEREWKVVKLENDYIEVYILPELGGKVWGAIEKTTGKEFIYMNKVKKFRDIALRGPWTSGGVEFNFGYIGHTPAAASPVDYLLRNNPDGSVSCIVGTMDLVSRTQWRVEIRLPVEKAWFETIATWYNPTAVTQSYYNWMTGAAKVADDLQFFYPGNIEYDHEGKANPWPRDTSSRDISYYANNNFCAHKSYHVSGVYKHYMGGYYHNENFGFGHWALYDDMPGKKLWLWALSDNGGIWEDLLTDTDGQYMEFQAGRTLNQYTPTDYKSPITQMGFLPGLTDSWREIWFPIKEIGGIQDAGPSGVLNVTDKGDQIQVAINSLASVETAVSVIMGSDTVLNERHRFKPMDVYTRTIPKTPDSTYTVIVKEMGLRFSTVETLILKRPHNAAENVRKLSSSAQYYHEGMELMEGRDYLGAKKLFQTCLEKDPFHLDAAAQMAQLYYRSCQYDSALYYINKVLSEDTYHAMANFQAGNVYVAKADWINALESFGWAARAMEYRSAAYAQMANIHLRLVNYPLALHYVGQSLQYNQHHVLALQTQAAAHRVMGDRKRATESIENLLTVDPLNHFAHFETYLLTKKPSDLSALKSIIKNEYPWQSYLELALYYQSLGCSQESLLVLSESPTHPLVEIWRAYLTADVQLLTTIEKSTADFVFPHRQETISALEWAASHSTHWKFKYYTALNYWAIDNLKEAYHWFLACNDVPDFAPFYASRAILSQQVHQSDQVLIDLQRACDLNPSEWRNWMMQVAYHDQLDDFPAALAVAEHAWSRFPQSYLVGLQYAQLLLNNRKPKASLQILERVNVLPYENAYAGREIYEQALIMQALDLIKQQRYKAAIAKVDQSLLWPSNLGVGAPFDPDYRIQHFLKAYCLMKQGVNTSQVERLLQEIVRYTAEHAATTSLNHVIGLSLIKQLSGQDDFAPLTVTPNHATPNAVHRWTLDTFHSWIQGRISFDTTEPTRQIHQQLIYQTLALKWDELPIEITF